MLKRKFNEKNLMIFIMTIVIFVIITVVGISVLFEGAKSVVKDYAKGMKNFDAEIIVDLYLDEMIKESYDSKEDMIKEYDLMFQDMKDNYYEIIRYSIDSNYKLYRENELEYKLDQLEEYYQIDNKDVKEIRMYNVMFECSNDGEKKDVEHKLLIAKIKSRWYLLGIE